jgi:hypothetical protein
VNLEPLALDRPDELTALIESYLEGRRPLTGLQLYYALEAATPLLQFHTMLRLGPRNLDANGLQQSYGDHNRLLLLGLDKLVEGDLDWYRARLDGAGDVSDDDLRECFAGVAALGASPAALVALWLGAGLHDCGMLGGRGSYVDVEDGIVLAAGVLDGLCPPDVVGVARFALRHHDYIKDRFTGEVPVAAIADDLAVLDAAQRRLALGVLGMIQVAGAASLGTGRLSAFRIAIFRRCTAGDALDGHQPEERLARLLGDGDVVDVGERIHEASVLLDARGSDRPALVALLDTIPVHGWHHVAAPSSSAERVEMLLDVAEHLAAEPADRVVLAPSLVPAQVAKADRRRDAALSGSRVLQLS